EEFGSYVWPPSTKSSRHERPVDEDNHGMDALRYACMYVDSNDGDYSELDAYMARQLGHR
ncbi:MAG: hypothetical protein KC438_14865, partial [Thermomicrobiales bacterium]|nr:hypothetical protein [Thermomicrobiales bacterium]